MSEPERTILTCYNHPNRETVLRCNRCDQPICVQCAVKTPTGYRCKQCVKSQQKVFITVKWFDYIVAIVAAGILSSIGYAVMMFVSSIFFLLGFFIGPPVGIAIAEVVRVLTGRRRAEWLFRSTAIAGGVVVLPFILLPLIFTAVSIGTGAGQDSWLNFLPGLGSLLYAAIYLITVVPSIYYRMKGIRLK
jgi:hypothetical protein